MTIQQLWQTMTDFLRPSKMHCNQMCFYDHVAFANLRDQLALAMPSIAYDLDLIHSFKVVIEVGAENQKRVGFLCDFLSKFVDPATRRFLRGDGAASRVGAHGDRFIGASILLPTDVSILQWPKQEVVEAGDNKTCRSIRPCANIVVFFSATQNARGLQSLSRSIGVVLSAICSWFWVMHSRSSNNLARITYCTNCKLSVVNSQPDTLICLARTVTYLTSDVWLRRRRRRSSQGFPNRIQFGRQDHGSPQDAR